MQLGLQTDPQANIFANNQFNLGFCAMDLILTQEFDLITSIKYATGDTDVFVERNSILPINALSNVCVFVGFPCAPTITILNL